MAPVLALFPGKTGLGEGVWARCFRAGHRLCFRSLQGFATAFGPSRIRTVFPGSSTNCGALLPPFLPTLWAARARDGSFFRRTPRTARCRRLRPVPRKRLAYGQRTAPPRAHVRPRATSAAGRLSFMLEPPSRREAGGSGGTNWSPLTEGAGGVVRSALALEPARQGREGSSGTHPRLGSPSRSSRSARRRRSNAASRRPGCRLP
jgi:hypothetical protein